jgi:arylsulfatase A-like enzyme
MDSLLSSLLRRLSLVLLLNLVALGQKPAVALGATLPNILWVTCEDTGQELGCYGDRYADTPNLDRLASQGMRYRYVWSCAPVCAPARTTIITGVEPTCLGAEHMRSEVALPAFMKLYPQFLRERGYYCSNNNKEDYNVTKPGKVWDDSSGQAHWKNRAAGQPFFAVFNILVSHESQIRTRPHTLQHDPAKAPLPAYHPDTPEVRHDWAQFYDQVTAMDVIAGRRLKELADAGLKDQTIVFFYGDHGSGMPRSKRFPYNSGLQVALLVYVPEQFKALAPRDYAPGGVSQQMVGFIDLAPTLLSLAGVQPPDWMQGHAFMGQYAAPPQPYLFGFRGRMDERYDLIRSVRNSRYIYIRNYMPHLIYGQFIDYMFQTPTTRVWKQLYDAGKLQPPQTRFWEPKPPEELYDLEADKSEVKNLLDLPQHRAILNELREALKNHILQVRDVGFLSEPEQHRRSAGTTLYELGHDPKKYPLEKILAMADTASLLGSEALPQLRAGLKDADSGVRYWAAMGLLMRGTNAVPAARQELHAALNDESPTVRIVAVRALGQFGNPDDLSLALPVLKELAPADKNGAYVSMLDLNAIDALGPKAEPLMNTLKTMPTRDPSAVARANEYVQRLVQDMTGSGDENQPARKAGKRGKKKQ